VLIRDKVIEVRISIDFITQIRDRPVLVQKLEKFGHKMRDDAINVDMLIEEMRRNLLTQ